VEKPGYSVVTTELTAYARHTRQLADELHRLAGHTVKPVGSIDEDAFGRIGKETGFAVALNHFADTLRRQLDGVAKNADTLGDGVAKTARTYRTQDQELAQDILDLIT
jgi:hypothetical protein